MNREVKIDNEVEVLDIANKPDEEEDDEVIIPPVEEEKEEEKTDDEPQSVEPSEPSPEDKEPLQQKVKPVEGETPKDRAWRAEVTHLRAERREEKNKRMELEAQYNSLKLKIPQEEIKNEKLDRLKETYSELDLKNLEDAIDVLAEKKGYIKKDVLEKENSSQTLNSFLDDHPEYKPENDKDDIRWERFTKILYGDYNLSGKTQKQLSIIFSKVHRDVCEELGETKEINEERKQAAQRQKIQSVSHSGGTKSKSVKQTDIDPEIRGMFKGFSDDDFS